mmetsp:Transcript_98312/g.283699  ORF Transcript_98312/g.283699 Transcript_98312/m.283699 type:complete len:275 (-) Transcript_98312:133-957(-)
MALHRWLAALALSLVPTAVSERHAGSVAQLLSARAQRHEAPPIQLKPEYQAAGGAQDEQKAAQRELSPLYREVTQKLFGHTIAEVRKDHDRKHSEHQLLYFGEGDEVFLSAVSRMLDILDGRRGGLTSKEELAQAAHHDQHPELEEVVRDLFAKADVDRDGGLDDREASSFKHLLRAYMTGSTGVDDMEDVVRRVFSVFDQHREGPIRKQQLMEAALSGDHPEVKIIVDEVFDRVDTEGTGVLDGEQTAQFSQLFRDSVFAVNADDFVDFVDAV